MSEEILRKEEKARETRAPLGSGKRYARTQEGGKGGSTAVVPPLVPFALSVAD